MITVLMPTFNCAEYLPYSITSILNQSYRNFEFLIIDDGSTDNSDKLIKKFNDKRIKFINKQHTGLADTLNYGVSIAKYDLIARMDSDDICHPNRLYKQFNFMLANKEIDILSTSYGVFIGNKILFIEKLPTADLEIKKKLIYNSTICHPGVIYKKKVIQKNRYHNIEFEDYELWTRLAQNYNFANLDSILYFVRFRSKSLSNENYHTKKKYIINISLNYFNNSPYFKKIEESEVIYYKGLLEFYYGDLFKSVKIWITLKSKIVFYPKVVLGIFTSPFGRKLINKLLSMRIKKRLQFCTMFFQKKITYNKFNESFE